MSELSQFITAHPWVTFGVFWVAMALANSLGGMIRIRVGGCKHDKDTKTP